MLIEKTSLQTGKHSFELGLGGSDSGGLRRQIDCGNFLKSSCSVAPVVTTG